MVSVESPLLTKYYFNTLEVKPIIMSLIVIPIFLDKAFAFLIEIIFELDALKLPEI